MIVIDIQEMCDCARYSCQLSELLNELGVKEVLRLEYEADYQGEVDIDALLSDGRVYSYQYYYGSCSGCDDWEARNLTDEQIKNEMLQEATIFDNIFEYNKWRGMVTRDIIDVINEE